MSYVTNTLSNLLEQTAFMNLTVGNYIMILVACVFLYLAIAKGFEPLLLVPIAFGMLLVNIYPDIMAEAYVDANGIEHAAGLLHYFYLMDEWSILPSLIFMGVGEFSSGRGRPAGYLRGLLFRYLHGLWRKSGGCHFHHWRRGRPNVDLPGR